MSALCPMGTWVYLVEAAGRERSQPHMARFFVPHKSGSAHALCTRWVPRCTWSRLQAESVATQFCRRWDLASPKGELCVFWSGPLKPSRKMVGGGRSGREVQGWGKFASGGACMDF